MRDEGAPGTEGDASQFKVFIGGLSYQINDQDLKAAFERFDAISAKVMIDRYTGRSRGFGFVFFKTDESLKEAIAQMHEKELDGRKISVVKAVPENQTSPGTPAAALGGGSGARRDYYPPRRDGYGGRGGGGYDRGYDRGYGGGGYDRGGYDRGGYGADYRGGYDRGGYGGAGYGYDRGAADPYGRDAYGRGYGGGGGYGGYYDDRSAGYGYDRGYGGYDDRGAGGPDRRGYSASTRTAPYSSERPPERPRYEGPPPRRP